MPPEKRSVAAACSYTMTCTCHAAEAAQPAGSAAPGPAVAATWQSAPQGSLTAEHVLMLLPAPGDAAEEVTQGTMQQKHVDPMWAPDPALAAG